MNAEIWMLLLKTGGTVGIVLAAIVWLFRKGGRVSARVEVEFGAPTGNGVDTSPALGQTQP
jgi:hypothetical protein